MMTTVLASLCLILIGLLVGIMVLTREQSSHIDWLRRENGIQRDELKSLMEAVARGARTSIQFDRGPKPPLEKLETYYEQRPQVTKVTAG